jgi:hypothetical protein
MVPTGGTTPYTFAVLTGTLSYDGGNGTYGSVNNGNKQYTAGTSVGTFTIQVSDNLGNTATTTVTVLPAAPKNFSASNGGLGLTDTLTWTYSGTVAITGFTIYSSPSNDGVNFSQLKTVSSTTTQTTNTVVGAGTYYQIVANSGPNSSSVVTTQSQ